MNALIETFLTKNGAGVWGAFTVLVILFLFHKQPFNILTYYTDRKDKDLIFVKDIVANGIVKSAFKEHMVSCIEQAVFLKLHKIDANSAMRSAMLKLQSKHDDTITWVHIRRAYPYLILKDHTLQVRLRWYHTVLWAATLLFVWIMVALFILLMAYIVFNTKSLPLRQATGIALQAILFLAGAVAFTTLNWPYSSAKRIFNTCKGIT